MKDCLLLRLHNCTAIDCRKLQLSANKNGFWYIISYYLQNFVTGVVLANASLDIALHDSIINKKIYYDLYLLQSSITSLGLFELKKEENQINNYIEPFFVGLLEGEGTITTDLGTSKKYIRVRIVIALKNEKNNQIMLNKIQEIIGGRVVIERQNKYVTWIASSQSDVNKVLLILARYPLLTIRKQCQLEFAKNCLLYKDFDNFIINKKICIIIRRIF